MGFMSMDNRSITKQIILCSHINGIKRLSLATTVFAMQLVSPLSRE
jgi:hypothetical protein